MLDHYELKLKQCGPKVDEAAIATAERHLGMSFPKAYREFLLANNGGVPSPGYIPYPGRGTHISRFFPIDEMVAVCKQHRNQNRLPDNILSVAELAGDDSVLLMHCEAIDAGALFLWVKPNKYGFRQNDLEYDNVGRLYFTVDELTKKFGPAKDRQDRDGMFCQLSYASSNPTHGPKLARKYVADGYDINFVLATFRHPIFGAIDSDAFGVACTFLELGTKAAHKDPLHDNASVADRLLDARTHWDQLLRVATGDNYETGIGMAKRRLSSIDAAISVVTAAG